MFRLLIAFLVVLSFNSQSNAEFLLSADFSTTQNPNGAWSYGMKDSTFGVFTQTGQISIASGQMVGWGDPSVFPFVLKNVTAGAVVDGTTTYQANAVALHPSSTGAHAVVRWTAPTSGLYSISSLFSDIQNDSAATVDVNVLWNNTAIFGSSLNSGVLSTSFSDAISFNSGDVVDFQVGNGGNGFGFDHTQLDLTITAVPEPSSLTLLTLFGLCTALCRKSRKLNHEER